MNDADRHSFWEAMKGLGTMYGKDEAELRNMSPMYWAALQEVPLDDVLQAMNLHVADRDRGRFFPKPADIIAQLPQAPSLWPTADEAWAMLPKDEHVSGAMCHEMADGLALVQDLIAAGDLIAARRSFIDHYNAKVEAAKAAGIRPAWWPSLGDDKDGRHRAHVKVVEMTNLALPVDQRKPLPPPPEQEDVGVNQLLLEAAQRTCDQEVAEKRLAEIKAKLGVRPTGGE